MNRPSLFIASPDLRRTPWREALFAGFDLVPRFGAPASTVAEYDWDAPVDRRRAARHAQRTGASRLRVSDGPLRSVAPRSAGSHPISIYVGPFGRTADDPSPLEKLLAGPRVHHPAVLAEAAELMAFKARHRLSQVNGHPALSVKIPAGAGRRRILVVDRTQDDGWLGAAISGDAVYHQMLTEALASGAQVIIKQEPGAGSAFDADDLRRADQVISQPVDADSLLAEVDEVYTTASVLGLEAIFKNMRVACFGAPVYGGWGLTEDRSDLARGVLLSKASLAAGLYVLGPRYADPLTREPCSATVAFERMDAFRRHARRTAGTWSVQDAAGPKRRVVESFLNGPMSKLANAAGASREDVQQLSWASPRGRSPRLRPAPQAAGLVRIEDGFIRSVGLGSGFAPASSIVLDRRGIYYDAGDSDLRLLLADEVFDKDTLTRAARLRRLLLSRGVTKYNVGGDPAPAIVAGQRRRILVPGQVANDASVATGGGGMSNLELLTRVRADNPDAYIVYKEHPDVAAGHRPGRLTAAQVAPYADLNVRDTDLLHLLEAVDEVHTLTSQTGFEALLRGKRVVTYGRPFYAGWGLTEDRHPDAAIVRKLTVDELVAGVLLLYPLYLDPFTGLPCDALTVVEHLALARAGDDGRGRNGRFRRWLWAGIETVRPRPLANCY